jgi:hypothetical protein
METNKSKLFNEINDKFIYILKLLANSPNGDKEYANKQLEEWDRIMKDLREELYREA